MAKTKQKEPESLAEKIKVFKECKEPAMYVEIRQLRVVNRLLARDVTITGTKALTKSYKDVGQLLGQCIVAVRLEGEEAEALRDPTDEKQPSEEHTKFKYLKAPKHLVLYGAGDGCHRSVALIEMAGTPNSGYTPASKVAIVPLRPEVPISLVKAYTMVSARVYVWFVWVRLWLGETEPPEDEMPDLDSSSEDDMPDLVSSSEDDDHDVL